MSDNELNKVFNDEINKVINIVLLNAVHELIEIVQEEMSSEWSREFIEKKLSKYTSLLKELEGLDDNLKC